MRAAVIQFPGSNCDRDLQRAFEGMSGKDVPMVWHKDTELPQELDIIGVPGGFSFGDYLRCGAIAARSPIIKSVIDFAAKGGHVIGICNGFQILCEAGLLPGVLMQNSGLKYICKDVTLRVETTSSPFTNAFGVGDTMTVPIAHHEGNYRATDEVLSALKAEDRIAFKYQDTPNGAADDIAGILSENRRVLGMMPHPERRVDPVMGDTQGARLFDSLTNTLVAAG